jgi:hypothetical protein
MSWQDMTGSTGEALLSIGNCMRVYSINTLAPSLPSRSCLEVFGGLWRHWGIACHSLLAVARL